MQAQRATLSPSVQNGNAARPMSAQFPESTDPMNPPFQHIDEEALFTDLHERVDYLRAFLNFTHEDVELLNDIVPLLEPLVDGLTDRVYAHLFQFDVTKKVFMPKLGDVDSGPMVTDLHHLTLEAPQIKQRKKFFAVYIRKLVSADYNDYATWQYFDQVGVMHTGRAGLKHRKLAGKDNLYVDLIHLTALLAWTQDALTPVILREPTMSMDRKIATIRSLSKVMWIQNDLFSRHYSVRTHDVKAVTAALNERDEAQSNSLEISSNGSSGAGGCSFAGSGQYNPHAQTFDTMLGPEAKEKRSFLSRLGL